MRAEQVVGEAGGDLLLDHPGHRLGVPAVGSHVGEAVVQARSVVECGLVVDRHLHGARRVELPRRYAGDDPALDGSDALDVLIALPVAEPCALD